MTACVVGAGCSISGTGIGDKIDAHDEVVRVNNHKITGYTKDVGTKCTVLCTFNCRQQLTSCLKLPILDHLRELWLFLPDRRIMTKTLDEIPPDMFLADVVSKFGTPVTIFGSPPWATFPPPKYKHKDNERVRKTLEYQRQQPQLVNRSIQRPSTGLMAVAMAIYRWGSVSIAGFGKHKSVRLGYYDKKLNGGKMVDRGRKTAHNYEAERLWFNNLESKKLLKRLD